MKLPCIALVLVLVLGPAAVPALAQEMTPTRALALTFEPDGRVSLSARNVTVREILAEWARQCACFVVNAERLQGGVLQVPLYFSHEAQGRVLESLLRQAAGFVLTPQRRGTVSRSDFETIYILASSTAVSNAFTPSMGSSAAPLPTQGAPDDELPPVVPMVPAPAPVPANAPAPGTIPPPMVPGQPQPSSPAATAPPASRLPGTPGTFVPIVPIGPGPATNAPAPGTVTPVTPATPGR